MLVREKQIKLYHRTRKVFDVLVPGGHDASISGPAIWLTDNPADIQAKHNVPDGCEGARTIPVYARMDRPFKVDQKAKELAWGDIPFPLLLTQGDVDFLKTKDYDSIIYTHTHGGREMTEYIVFDSEQVRSAIGGD
jgi:hypothetical protein